MAKKILIAEDEPSIVAAIEFLLSRAGYEVLIARDGDEALDMVSAARPDLVVLDIMLPMRSGFDVCARIRENPELERTKIVMLTARRRDVDVNRGLALGADLYMTKPFSTRELMEKIAALLAS